MGEVKRTDKLQGKIIHEYDGIEEADNDLPRWWLLTFYGAIAFAVFYWFYYQEFSIGDSPYMAYAKEAARAAAAVEPPTEEELVAMSQDEATVAAGRALFATTCVACHGEKGEGKIGPNLTDDHFLHGAAPLDVYGTIAGGVPAKQMPAWLGPLGPDGVANAAAYVLTLMGTNVPGKAPEGERVSGESAGEDGGAGVGAEESVDAGAGAGTGE